MGSKGSRWVGGERNCFFFVCLISFLVRAQVLSVGHQPFRAVFFVLFIITTTPLILLGHQERIRVVCSNGRSFESWPSRSVDFKLKF